MGCKSSTTSVLHVPLRAPIVVGTALAVGVSVGAAAGMARAQPDGFSQELGAIVNEYIVSWNTHDPLVLAEHFTADADMIMGNGPVLGGRTAVLGWWRDYFAVQEPERTLTIEVQSTRAIATDVVLVNVRTTTHGRTAEGVELPSRKARGTWVLVRQDGRWLISAMRGMPTEQDRIIRSGG